MTTINHIINRIIVLRTRGTQITLLAVCPNSDAVLEAAIKVTATKRNWPRNTSAPHRSIPVSTTVVPG
jgi:hypothetical protein